MSSKPIRFIQSERKTILTFLLHCLKTYRKQLKPTSDYKPLLIIITNNFPSSNLMAILQMTSGATHSLNNSQAGRQGCCKTVGYHFVQHWPLPPSPTAMSTNGTKWLTMGSVCYCSVPFRCPFTLTLFRCWARSMGEDSGEEN